MAGWSGVALTMCHRLQWFIHLRAHGLREGDEYPAYTPLRSMAPFTFAYKILADVYLMTTRDER